MTPVRRVCALLAATLVLASCRVDASVQVTMHDDGSGTIDARVTLDADALSRVEQNGRTLETAILLDDLRAAKWNVHAWKRNQDGGATLRLTHDFTGEQQLEQRLDELAGSSRIFDAVRVIHDRGTFRSRDEVSVDTDLRGLAAGITGDTQLANALRSAGLDTDALETQLTSQLRDAFRLTVAVETPNGSTDEAQLAAGDHARVTAAHKSFDSGKVAVLMMIGLLAFLAVLLYLSASISARRDRARRRVASEAAEPDRTPLM